MLASELISHAFRGVVMILGSNMVFGTWIAKWRAMMKQIQGANLTGYAKYQP